jgi:hypothetical protein
MEFKIINNTGGILVDTTTFFRERSMTEFRRGSSAGCARQSLFFIALCLLRLADRAALQTMKDPSPQRPALPVSKVLVLEPSGLRQLSASIRVTHSHKIGLNWQPEALWQSRDRSASNVAADGYACWAGFVIVLVSPNCLVTTRISWDGSFLEVV